MQDKQKIQFFSDKTGKFYQLLPTTTIPALRINAVPMHRFAKVDPLEDAKRKINAAKPRGKVLDICTGLGYTAIQASKRSEVMEVITIEQDSEVLALCKINEASSELFKNPKIKIIEADACEKIREFADASFDCIVHDPPTFVVSPGLYTKNFYMELLRVLKRGGRLWHYAANPGKAGGKSGSLAGRIMKNLKLAGFGDIDHDEHSTGIICRK